MEQCYHNIIDHISCAVHYITVTNGLYKWKFVSLTPFHLFVLLSTLFLHMVYHLYSILLTLIIKDFDKLIKLIRPYTFISKS